MSDRLEELKRLADGSGRADGVILMNATDGNKTAGRPGTNVRKPFDRQLKPGECVEVVDEHGLRVVYRSSEHKGLRVIVRPEATLTNRAG